MVGCAAYGCTNRSEKGFLMKKFPKDSVRRKIWAGKVKRDGWKPTNASVLCEAHFLSILLEEKYGLVKLKEMVGNLQMLQFFVKHILMRQCGRKHVWMDRES
ncbi:THAP domain [Popillia japonica]|uniref:THAP domain n=1 Tax=Popillia japonica TaxID=7064 RepID=A0AAW1JRS7_POPJA